jgi:hypothetical protein
LWQEFLAIRTAKRKPLTPRAWAAIAKRIEDAGVTVTEALTTAVENSWADWDPGWVDGARTRRGSKPAEPPRNIGKSALAECVLHDPDSDRCMCDRCESDRRRGSGYGERVAPSGAKRPGVSA